MSVFFFLGSTNRRNFPFGLVCANIGLAYLLKGNVVMMPYFSIGASSTKISSLRLIGARRIWL